MGERKERPLKHLLTDEERGRIAYAILLERMRRKKPPFYYWSSQIIEDVRAIVKVTGDLEVAKKFLHDMFADDHESLYGTLGLTAEQKEAAVNGLIELALEATILQAGK